jgi:alanine racemase
MDSTSHGGATPEAPLEPPARQAAVDLGAITGNVAALRERVRGSQVMAVVKADGYGHGMIPAARAALAGGADWLGTADLTEALALRADGITAPVLCLMAIGEPGDAIRAGVDVTAASVAVVTRVAEAAARVGVPARLHLKADTGLSRGGATRADWPGVVQAALAAQAAGRLQVVGLWSHFACADLPGHPSIAAQLTAFADAVAHAEKAGVTPEVRHIANTAAALTVPGSRLDLVRFGGALYGISTLPGGAPSWLRPVMTLRARLALVKRVPPGSGVSYGHRYVTERETTLGLVPVGYADGVPRAAAGLPLVAARGRRWPIAGTVCMDQFVVDFGDEPVTAGEEVVLFGPGDDGEPTAQEWGEALGTISYEIVTGIGARVSRTYPGGSDELSERNGLRACRTAYRHRRGHARPRPPAGRPAARRRPGHPDRAAGRGQDHPRAGHRRGPRGAGAGHVADLRHRAGPPRAGRIRAVPGARGRLPARQHQRGGRSGPRRGHGHRGHGSGMGRGTGRRPGRRPPGDLDPAGPGLRNTHGPANWSRRSLE